MDLPPSIKMPAGDYGFRVEAIFAYLGGVGLNGAIVYCGGSKLLYLEREDESKPDASFVDEHGMLRWQTGVRFTVNGKPGQTWLMFVTCEPDDTFTVRLYYQYGDIKRLKTGKWGEVLAEATGVYNDDLQSVVESMYDEQITKHHGGIPI
jgi:hypothetical protein